MGLGALLCLFLSLYDTFNYGVGIILEVQLLLPAFGLFCFLFYKFVRSVIKFCKQQKAGAVAINDANDDEDEQLLLHQRDNDDDDDDIFAHRLLNPED